MSRRRTSPGQLDLFTADSVAPAPATPESRKEISAGFGGQVDTVAEVLGEIHDGRYGRLDATDRIVWLDGDGHCRHAPDGDAEAVESLLAQRYAILGPVTTQLQGVIRKDVYLIKLTPGGDGLRIRWSRLKVVKR
ncbi:hypothetical protein FKR81_04375 [Lentzea tibetensis]|uniref:Uncharacterized protein n=1 Tax=Lentzea tibetensis TaxID=2591470 RepID=A0A563F000_9PSEU|nr:hypothetical protein [Lentzea tibetensis]TWP53213.1 hypothetical protein FKR81_04375 [Lentzea tibetensis]